jgi:HK97 family phage major capsid protein
MAELSTPDKLPVLRRVLPLELTAVRKVARIKTAEDVRKAIAGFDKAPVAELTDVRKKDWRRIVAAAKKLSVDLAVECKKSAYFETPEFVTWRAAAETKPAGDPEDDEDPDDEDEADSDRFDMSFSSEAPVARWFGEEVLDHSARSVDMSRAANGLAYLRDHDTGDQVGIIENLRLEKNKLRGTVRFSRSARAQDVKRDVQDGIRPFTSIGYRVNEMVLEKEEKNGGDVHRTYRVTSWTPMEGSSVAVPADTSVGAGRSSGSEEFAVQVRSAIQAAPPAPIQTSEVRTMSATVTPLTPKDSAEILRLCATHGIDSKLGIAMIEKDGMSIDQASREILALVGQRDAKTVTQPAAEMLSLTEREQRRYSLCRGIMTHVRNAEDKGKRETSFETEVSDEIAKHQESKKGGLFVPYRLNVDPQLVRDAVTRYGAELLKRAGTTLAAATATQGAETVFTEPGEFIQFLYNAMRLKELGAETMSGLQGNVAFPKQTGRATGSWVAENPGSDVADSNLTLGQVLTSPKTYQTSASYSRQLLAQAVIDIDNLVRADLARDAALAIDLAGISGTGSSNQPKGILHTTGVQAYVVDADTGNGGMPAWTDITKMQELLENVNADQIGEARWLTTPGIKGLFKRVPRLLYAPAGGTVVNVTGTPIWADDDEIDGLMARWSNQVPANLVKGTSGANCSALILGVFSSMINGLWGSGFELVVDPYRLKKQGLIELTTFILTDWAIRYPAGFVSAVDCLKA